MDREAPATDPLLIEAAGHRECLLGNEAIVRGALEAGVVFAAGYPGTPSSEITDGFARIARESKLFFEYAVNEKIALELAFAASLAGARSICAMKHLGLMVAGDPLSTIPYVGVEAGMVIVSAGDPSCHTSPNEADQRHLGPMLHLPVLDPSTPGEALEMTRFAFDLSEQTRLPVLMRTTTRLAHSRGVVEYGKLREPVVRGFSRDPARYVPLPSSARRMRLEIRQRMAKAREILASSGFFRCEGSGKNAILATGAPAATVADLLKEQGIELEGGAQLWRLGVPHPLPEAELVRRLGGVDRVLVVEELSPFLEHAILSLVARHGLPVRVLGKLSGHLPEEFEYEPDVIQRGMFAALGLGRPPAERKEPWPLAPRAPSLCPGCPHRAAFFAARAAFPEDQLFFNDIGCYTLGHAPPLSTADALLCMGAGFTLAAGVSRVTGRRTVGFVGDSTFFHAGMPALCDAIKEKSNVVAVVLDNQVTAMTGFQESPTRGRMIEEVARALGAEHVETIDPYDLEGSIAAFRRAAARTDTSVVVVRRACPVHQARIEPQPRTSFTVALDRCRRCGRESHGLRCSVPLSEGYERNLARVSSTLTQKTPSPEIAPCATRCPLALCVQGYAGHIAAGEYAEAVRHVMDRTPLPESICRVCHRPCEDGCVRSAVDEPIAVNDLKRFVVEWADLERPELLQATPGDANGLSVAVVGAGVAGLSAARDLRLRGCSVRLYDAKRSAGGMLRHGIPEYRLPESAVSKDVARVLELGVRFEGGRRLGREIALSGLLGRHDAVLVAVGAWRPKKLDLPRAASGPVVIEALEYLARVRAGEPVPAAERVVVVGGGNAAIDASRTALRKGAAEVTAVCLETRAEMPALRDEIAAAEHEGVAIRCALRPVRYDQHGLCVAPLAGGAEELCAAGLVIVAIGQDPELEGLDIGLDLDGGGCLRVDARTGRTSHPKIFAAGDAAGMERTVTSAAASGLRAAWGIDVELRGLEIANRRAPPIVPATDESWRTFAEGLMAPPAPRCPAPEQPARERIQSFSEVSGRLSEEEARAEARRCLMCGLCGNCRACMDTLGCPALGLQSEKASVNASLCIGCGVCADVCTNDALGPRGRA